MDHPQGVKLMNIRPDFQNENYFEIGMIIGVAVGLLDALRAVATGAAGASATLGALLISTAVMGMGGGVLSTVIFWLLAKSNIRRATVQLTWRKLGRDLLRLTATVLGVSLAGFLVESGLSRLASDGSHMLRTLIAFFVSSVVVVVVARAMRPLAVRRPAGFPAGLAIISAVAIGGVFLTGANQGIAAKIDAPTPQAQLASVSPPGIINGVGGADCTSGGDAAPATAAATAGGGAVARPNILFIVLDTVRADHLSLYGYPRETTPFLSEFAREATVYERAIAAAPWTLPSHATMFTGQLPSVHRATTEHRLLRPEFVTIAEILRNCGYATAGFSSNSVVGAIHNLNQGFDDFYEVWKTMHPAYGPIQRLVSYRQLADVFRGEAKWRDKGARETRRLVTHWLEEKEQDAPDKPFFIFINYLESHLPYDPPEAQRRKFLDEPLLPPVAELCSEHWMNQAFRLMGLEGALTTDGYRQLAALYDAEIAYLDGCLRDLFADLRAAGELENTCVIIASDHGENIGEHGGLLDHCLSVHQTLLHVPLLVRFPPLFASGLRYPDLVTTTSIFPTILEVAGAAADPAWPPAVGSLPTRSDDPPTRFVVSEYALPVWELSLLASEVNGVDIRPYAVRQECVQNDAWKLVRPSEGPPRLYDLTRDPGETNPLDPGASPAGPELQAYLDRWLAAIEPIDLPPPHVALPMDEETRKSLRSLGYVH
jgi:arylsulfatase A-like enzyme